MVLDDFERRRQARETGNERLVAAGHGPIEIHIGIGSASVAAGCIGTEKYIQYAVTGDTTNVASRICSVAGADEILLAESTRLLLTRPGVMLEPLSPVVVKGKAPLVLYRIRLSQESVT